VRSKTTPTNPTVPRMICSINIHEFGSDEEFHADNTYVSAYPTWSASGSKTFRPTNAGCLMRNMTHESLCNVCREGMWYQFLDRISLIDDLRVRVNTKARFFRTLTLDTPKLGQLRDAAYPVTGEKLEVKWFMEGEEQESWADHFEIVVPTGTGTWTAKVTFITSEVRSDPDGLLSDSRSVIV